MKMKNENKNWISGLHTIPFQGKEYKLRDVYVKGFGLQTIGGYSLLAVLYPNDEYPSEEAENIDNLIDYYVEDKYLSCGDKQLASKVEKEEC